MELDVLMVRVQAPASSANAAIVAKATRPPLPPTRMRWRTPDQAACLVKLEHRHESLLRDLNRSHSLLPLLAFLLFLQQLPLPGHVASVTLPEPVLSHR